MSQNIKGLFSDWDVLVVDDEADLRESLASALEQAGFEVLIAKDGPSGLLLALKKHPDVILLDILLPRMQGNVILDRLRADNWGKQAKVIVLSNSDRNDHKELALRHGALDYLIKSEQSLSDIIRSVKKALLQEHGISQSRNVNRREISKEP